MADETSFLVLAVVHMNGKEIQRKGFQVKSFHEMVAFVEQCPAVATCTLTRTLRYSKDFDDFLDITNECIQMHDKFKLFYEERPVQVQSGSVKAQNPNHETEERQELSSAPRDKPSCSGLMQATLLVNNGKIGVEAPVTSNEYERSGMTPSELEEKSHIFGTDAKERKLTKYQEQINKMALLIAKEKPDLLQRRGELLKEARVMLHESGYSYKRANQSRSKVFGKGTKRKGTSPGHTPTAMHKPLEIEKMAETRPPKDYTSENQSALNREKKQEMILMEPYNYILQVPGKQVRTKLSRAFNYWMDIPEDKIQKISEVVQMLHNASLLIDDIEDSSKLRRGIPVAHSIYGIAQTINSANYIYFLGLKEVMQFEHPDAMKIFTEQLVLLHQGQGMDIYWRDSYTCPTEEEYKEMVIKKTGGLFGLAVRLMQLFSANKSDFKPLSDILGLYFQIRDDYANLCSKQYTENKSYCEDLTEGKFSFPVIHGIRSQPENTQVMSILRQRTVDMDVKKYCVELLEKFGSFEYTRKVLFDLEKQAYQHISNLGGNPILESILDELGKLMRQGDQ